MSDETKIETKIDYVPEDKALHAFILEDAKARFGITGMVVESWKNTGGSMVAKLVPAAA